MGLLVRLAWRSLLRHRRRTLITASAIAVGVAMCMATVALQAGMFQRLFSSLVERQTGHAQIHTPAFPTQRALHETLPDGAALLDELRRLPLVASATPRLYGFALLGAEDESLGAQLIGVDPKGERALTHLDDSLVAGRYLPERPGGGVLLGTGVAERLHVGVGDEIVVVTQAADGSLGNELYVVTGIFETGASALDRGGVFLHREDLGRLLVLDDAFHEIALLAPSRDDIPAMVEQVRRVTSREGLLLRDWRELSPSAAELIGLQNVSLLLVVGIIFGVAALGILNTMLMSVFDRTRELGVLLALGLTPGRVLASILFEAVLLALLGIVVGGAIGGLLDVWLIHSGIDLGDAAAFSTSGVTFEREMKGVFVPRDVAGVFSSVLVISTLAALWPAIRAARLPPVIAMRRR